MTESPGQSEQNTNKDNSCVPTVSARVKIVNSDGIHMRPALQIVKTASQFECDVNFVQNNYMNIAGQSVAYGKPNFIDGKSIMQLTMLSLVKGSEATIECVGKDANEALAAIIELIESGFGED